MQLLITFLTLAGLLPPLLRWASQGKLSAAATAWFALLLVFLWSRGRRTFRFLAPLVGLTAFGLQYADDGTWRSFASALAALLPLSLALLGIYVLFQGLGTGGPRRRR